MGTDLSFYFSLLPNSRPIDQSSGVRSLSECYFYRMEVFMTNNFSSHDHLAVGVKFPNGTEQKPMSGNNLYWLKPGINLKFKFLTLFLNAELLDLWFQSTSANHLDSHEYS